MKFSNNEIIEAKGALDKLIQLKLPVKVSFGIVKIAKKLSEAIDTFATVRDGLLNKYAIKVEKGSVEGTITFTSEIEGNAGKFFTEFKELLEQENELVFDKVKLPNDLEIEPATLLPLDKFVEI